jgi:Zn-dependent protease with chaperone function
MNMHMTWQQMQAMCSGLWLAYTAGGALLLVIGGLLFTVVRALWLLAQAATEVSALPLTRTPERLARLAADLGIRCLVCVEGASPVAFCAGGLRPSIYVSEGLASALGDAELEAVLLHEQDHLDQREPLRRALRRAATWGFFYVPLLRWWARCQAERSELRADRLALSRVAPQVLARALLRADWATLSLRAATAFAGAAEARVAQLLGDPVPARRPGLRLWALSVAGITLALWTTHCAGGMLIFG